MLFIWNMMFLNDKLSAHRYQFKVFKFCCHSVLKHPSSYCMLNGRAQCEFLPHSHQTSLPSALLYCIGSFRPGTSSYNFCRPNIYYSCPVAVLQQSPDFEGRGHLRCLILQNLCFKQLPVTYFIFKSFCITVSRGFVTVLMHSNELLTLLHLVLELYRWYTQLSLLQQQTPQSLCFLSGNPEKRTAASVGLQRLRGLEIGQRTLPSASQPASQRSQPSSFHAAYICPTLAI